MLSPPELVTIIEFSKLPEIAEKIDKFLAKKLYPILILVKANFCLNSQFS